jgi:hypothetical protein
MGRRVEQDRCEAQGTGSWLEMVAGGKVLPRQKGAVGKLLSGRRLDGEAPLRW